MTGVASDGSGTARRRATGGNGEVETGMSTALPPIDRRLRALGRRLVSRHPRWESALLRSRDGYARSLVRCRWLANRLRYDAPPKPYRLIEVDPASIQRIVSGPKYTNASAVGGGDRDRSDERFEETDV